MRHEYRPLYITAIAVLVTGLIVGLAFAGVSDAAVLTGTTVLAGLMYVLFLLSRRSHAHHDDKHEQHDTSSPR